jgi:hypothetical protein
VPFQAVEVVVVGIRLICRTDKLFRVSFIGRMDQDLTRAKLVDDPRVADEGRGEQITSGLQANFPTSPKQPGRTFEYVPPEGRVWEAENAATPSGVVSVEYPLLMRFTKAISRDS